MTINAKTLFGVTALLGVAFSGQTLAANSFQEAWEEEQADVRAQEVIEAPANIVKSTQWYLQGVNHPYVDNIDDVRVASEIDTTPWYFQG